MIIAESLGDFMTYLRRLFPQRKSHPVHAGTAERGRSSIRCFAAPASWSGRPLGFTLIELMVVVVIISILTTMAVPTITKKIKNYEAKATAEEIATMFRGARLKAMGRGSAVLVQYDSGTETVTVREAIVGSSLPTDAAMNDCEALPSSSCSPVTKWADGGADNQILDALT
ncbi:MAG: prepilin-type N-terminal cleavage/methylation domain-containing protein, partial [Polyangiaceae bacterium]|nr:prepilin-type N-terminal cleavage/methylation domain-containing protein [Polyangiaceae bacterium]